MEGVGGHCGAGNGFDPVGPAGGGVGKLAGAAVVGGVKVGVGGQFQHMQCYHS